MQMYQFSYGRYNGLVVGGFVWAKHEGKLFIGWCTDLSDKCAWVTWVDDPNVTQKFRRAEVTRFNRPPAVAMSEVAEEQLELWQPLVELTKEKKKVCFVVLTPTSNPNPNPNPNHNQNEQLEDQVRYLKYQLKEARKDLAVQKEVTRTFISPGQGGAGISNGVDLTEDTTDEEPEVVVVSITDALGA